MGKQLTMFNKHKSLSVLILAVLCGCSMEAPPVPYVPSLRYSQQPEPVAAGYSRDPHRQSPYLRTVGDRDGTDPQLRLVDGDYRPDAERNPRILNAERQGEMRGASGEGPGDDVQVYRSREMMKAAYRGPLSLGDPGASASLWRESRGGNDIFRDSRAWQPMDLLTIVVTEKSKGSHDADTELKSESTVEAAIQNLLGLETKALKQNPPLNVDALIKASSTNDFKGEGTTTRKGELTARISAVVAEVLPSGLLRIEGEKIISVNNEEQVMVISGLTRTRDISSTNEIDSSKIAQLRVDYYGQGEVGSVQHSGWLSRILRYIWPF